eukprot:TRINITY_DN243_c0_g3_i2.p1 TRINITY_DN243_c0_g3~~TRINITY_DN243_c0_g3_i2.p1  ORF type:complete len:340 (+),score=50.66 TRINITY_DN243_c0_g3_i2:95-1114(+)
MEDPILLVTDIGNDIDDTIALLWILGRKLNLVGVVTTGTQSGVRAGVVTSILRGGHATEVPTVPGDVRPVSQSTNVVDEWIRTIPTVLRPDLAATSHPKTGAEFIVDCARTHGAKLRILLIAPYTDVARAIELDRYALQSIGGVCMQAQANMDSHGLTPSLAAYNIRCDPAAAEVVFTLQHHVPFTFLGKHAAYRVSLSALDFDLWDAALRARVQLRLYTERQLDHLRHAAPDLYERVYGVPASVPPANLSKLSHPYDALAAMTLVPEYAQLFDTQSYRSPVNAAVEHTLIGQTPDTHGVPDPKAIHDCLFMYVMVACNTLGAQDPDVAHQAEELLHKP